MYIVTIKCRPVARKPRSMYDHMQMWMLRAILSWFRPAEPWPAEMGRSRWFRMFQRPRNIDELAAQVTDLRLTLFSAIQDLIAMQKCFGNMTWGIKRNMPAFAGK